MSFLSVLYSHHEQYSWYNEARVGCITEKCPHEGWKIQVNGLHDHIKHLFFPTANINTISACAASHFFLSGYFTCSYLKGPQSNEGGRVMMV